MSDVDAFLRERFSGLPLRFLGPNERLSFEHIHSIAAEAIELSRSRPFVDGDEEGRGGDADCRLEWDAQMQGGIQYGLAEFEGMWVFNSIRANAFVFSGRWYYEVTLGTGGVMQIGWCQHDCTFSFENGVGDSPLSYAYDGRRCCVWGVESRKYGPQTPWQAGDVVGCALDLDEGTVSFYLNGEPLGVAFRDIGRGVQGVAYFPAVSVHYADRCAVNMGALPFLYPLEGHRPVHSYPRANKVTGADIVFGLIENEVPFVSPQLGPVQPLSYFLMAALCEQLMTSYLEPSPVFDFVVASVVVPFLARAHKRGHLLHFIHAIYSNLNGQEAADLTSSIMQHAARLVRALPMIPRESDDDNDDLDMDRPLFLPLDCPFPTSTDALEFAVALLSIDHVRNLWLGPGSSSKLVFPTLELLFFTRKAWSRQTSSIISSRAPLYDSQMRVFDSSESDVQPHVTAAFRRHALVQHHLVQAIMNDGYVTNHTVLVLESAVSHFWAAVHANGGNRRNRAQPSAWHGDAVRNLFFSLLQTVQAFLQDPDAAAAFPVELFMARDYLTGWERLGGTPNALIKAAVENGTYVEGGAMTSERRALLDSVYGIVHGPDERAPPHSVSLIGIAACLFALDVAEDYRKASHTQQQVVNQVEANQTSEEPITDAQMEKRVQFVAQRSSMYSTEQLSSLFDLFNFLVDMILAVLDKPEFPFVPLVYLSCIFDLFYALRHTRPLLPLYLPPYRATLDKFVTLLVRLLEPDRPLLNPDIMELVLRILESFTQCSQLLAVLEQHELARSSLVPLLLQRSKKPRTGYAVLMLSHFFLGQRFASPPVPRPTPYSWRSGGLQPSLVFQEAFIACARDPAMHERMLAFSGELLGNCHMGATELFTAVNDFVDLERNNDLSDEQRQQLSSLQSKCVLAATFALVHLQVIEVFAREAPRVFIESNVTMARLADLVLSVFVRLLVPAQSKAFLRFAQVAQPSKDVDRFIKRGVWISLLLGTLCGLEDYCRATETSFTERVASVLAAQGLMTADQFQSIITENIVSEECRASEEEVSKAHVVLEQIIASYRQSAASDALSSNAIPEELICTICYAAPVAKRFKPCGHESCALCIGRHQINSDLCFFCKTAIDHTEDM